MTQGRTYVSPKRATQSRDTSGRILVAARILFARSGYVGTTIEAIAREAGVSVQTIYQRFGDKAALLRAQLDDIDRFADLSALRVALEDQDAPPRAQAQALVQFVGRISEVVVPLIVARRALNDPELMALEDNGLARHRQGAAGLAAQWEARGLLAEGLSVDEAATTLAAICSISLFTELRDVQGLSRSATESWIVDAVERLLLQDEKSSAHS